jgi:hypothetical protein
MARAIAIRGATCPTITAIAMSTPKCTSRSGKRKSGLGN